MSVSLLYGKATSLITFCLQVENVGCESCGYCVHTLLDDFDEMNDKMDIADREFEKVSASQFAAIRLNRLGQTIGNLSQAVNFLTITGAPQTLLVGFFIIPPFQVLSCLRYLHCKTESRKNTRVFCL